VTNNGILEAQNGGQLTLSSNVTGNTGSEIIAGANSVVLQNGVTISGDINAAGTGSFRSSNSTNNFFDGANFTGDFDMATAESRERIINGLTLNGTFLMARAALFSVTALPAPITFTWTVRAPLHWERILSCAAKMAQSAK
jgi:hypothetical protein